MQYLIYFGIWNDSICSPSAQLCIAEEWWMLITGKTICSRTADRLRWTTFNVFISSASRCWYLWFTVQQDETTKPYWQNVISNQRIMDGVIFFSTHPPAHHHHHHRTHMLKKNWYALERKQVLSVNQLISIHIVAVIVQHCYYHRSLEHSPL